MQTVLLAVWPFLNLILLIGFIRTLNDFVTQFTKKPVYQFGASACLILPILIVSQTVRLEREYKFVFQQPQLTVPILRQAYHDGILLNSPVFSIKSHVAVWPIKLPDTTQPAEPGVSPDALQITLQIRATDLMPGLQWVPENTIVRLEPTQKLVYEASGHITWRLLGLPVYFQPKKYIGTMRL